MSLSLRKLFVFFLVPLLIIASLLWILFVKEETLYVGKTNDFSISLSEAEAAAGMLSQNPNKVDFLKLDESAQSKVLNEFVINKLASQKASDLGLDDNFDIEGYVDAYRQQLLKWAYVQHLVNEKITEDLLKAEYDRLKNDIVGQTRIHANHILVKTEDEALEIKKKLQKESFEQLAQQYSLDKKSAVKGGNLGYLITGNMDKNFEKESIKLKVGNVSNPVQTQYGWHLIRLNDKEPAQAAPYEQAKANIARDLTNKIIQGELQNLLKTANLELLVKSIQEEEAPLESNSLTE